MKSTYETMGGKYQQNGDYLLPNLEVPESHESDLSEIREGFKELDELLGTLPLDDNNTVFYLCCSLCSAYERKAFMDGVQYGAWLLTEITTEQV